jgi:hypothetical protein
MPVMLWIAIGAAFLGWLSVAEILEKPVQPLTDFVKRPGGFVSAATSQHRHDFRIDLALFGHSLRAW